jgi:NADH:ubiquinone oxidoreductase subunit 5 (subunit L)/multisubunit Na+/H+ antiporter MnhA subunit
MAIYIVAWFAVVLPLLGAGTSFFAESTRRAGQVCRAFAVLSFLLTLVALATRIKTASQAPFDSFITFFTMSPPEGGAFPSRFEMQLGVHVDSLTAVFAALSAFVVVGLQSYAGATLRGDPAYRRFFWASSLLLFAVLGLAYSPNLFQFWLMSGMLTVSVYILLLHWWNRPEAGAPARRVFVTMYGADVALLLAVAFIFLKFGNFALTQTPPAGTDVFDPLSFSGLQSLIRAAQRGAVTGVGLKTLEAASILVLVVAFIRSLQVPFHVWLGEVVNAPAAIIALVLSSTGMAGVYLLAREYPLLLGARHVLAAVAVVGAATAAFCAALALVQRDLYRSGALVSASMLGIAAAAIGAGGFASGLFALAVASLLAALFFTAAGNISRAYRSRDLDELGGAWQRMRASSIALGGWALGAGGFSLTAYYALAAAFDNHLPGGGHLAGAARAATIALLVVGGVLVSAAAFRVVVSVCAGEPARRRGFQFERVREPRDASSRWVIAALVVTAVLVIVGIPGIGLTHPAHGPAVGLTWNDFILFGSRPPDIHVVFLALGISLVTLAVGWLLVSPLLPATRLHQALANFAAHDWVRGALPDLYLERAFRRAGAAFVFAGSMLVRFDDRVGEALPAAAAESVGLVADVASRARRLRSNAYLAGSAAFAGAIVVIALLAATGHLGGVTL